MNVLFNADAVIIFTLLQEIMTTKFEMSKME